jgi:hypothetical protein
MNTARDGWNLTHKLLIQAGVDLPPKYESKVAMFELVRGVSTHFALRIENLGDSVFPGGEILGGQIRFESICSMLTIFSDRNVKKPEIPELKKSGKHVILFDFTPIMSGPHSMSMEIKATDGQRIEYYTSKSGEPTKKNWEIYMYVIERENLDSLILLEKIFKKTTKKKKEPAKK